MRYLLSATIIGLLFGMSPVQADDFTDLLTKLSFSDASPMGHQANLMAPAPPMPQSINHQDARVSPFADSGTALGAMTADSMLVEANPIGHLFNRKHKSASCDEPQCDRCESCEVLPPTTPRTGPKCKLFGKGCGESCVVLPPEPCQCDQSRHCFLHRNKGKTKAPKTCPPRQAANLPSSTFLQYFRSDRCNTQVWDGYSRKCGDQLKHIHGQCDCFEEKDRQSCLGGQCGEIINPKTCSTSQCDGCKSCTPGWIH